MNPFQVGDKVRFLNAEGHGIITKIINDNQVELENEYGFDEVYDVKELVGERSKEDYKTDNLAFNQEVNQKLKADQIEQQASALRKKFKHLEKYGGKDRDVIDLHVENLIDSHQGMSNSQILNIQMTHFRRFLNQSINKQQRKIVVIHGVGEGVLRHEIRKELDVYYSEYKYYDAPYEEFGMGATEIILKP